MTVSGPTAGTEVDPWFAEKSKYVASLKQHLETLAISATAVTQYHQGSCLSKCWGDQFFVTH